MGMSVGIIAPAVVVTPRRWMTGVDVAVSDVKVVSNSKQKVSIREEQP
jgi:hypothetical protein